jgi:hypothetical protein
MWGMVRHGSAVAQRQELARIYGKIGFVLFSELVVSIFAGTELDRIPVELFKNLNVPVVVRNFSDFRTSFLRVLCMVVIYLGSTSCLGLNPQSADPTGYHLLTHQRSLNALHICNVI